MIEFETWEHVSPSGDDQTLSLQASGCATMSDLCHPAAGCFRLRFPNRKPKAGKKL